MKNIFGGIIISLFDFYFIMAFYLPLGLFFFFISAQESLVFGQTNSSLGQSRVVTGVYDNKETVPSAAVSLNMTQWTTTDSSFFATKNLQTTVITSNNKGNEVSFTKASTEKVLPALSTRLVAKSQLNEFIKSLLSTNVLPENLSTKYSSLNTQRSVFNDKEDNFTISSIPSAMTPEIVPTTSQVNGIKTSSSRDKMHLSTFQKEDKSLVSSQEASTKSAFYDTRGESKGFNLRTVQFTSSPIFSPILVEINSATVVRANNETNLFTKGSVSLAHWQRTFSIRSAIWKTSELKPFSETTSHSSPDKETSQHSTQTFDTKMSTEAMKVKFTGISGISQNTAEAKMTPEDKGFISPFDISTSPAIEIAATSAGASVAHRPPSTKHKNLSFSLVVTASPVVSSRSKRFLSTDTMTIPTTPLNQLSVTSVKGSNFSSKTKTEFRALTKEVTKGYTGNHYGLSSILAHAGSSHSPSNMAQQSPNSNQSIYESTPFVVPVGTLPPSEVSQGMQTVSSIKSKTSEQNYVMSSSSEEYFPVSVNTTENVVRKTSVNLKLISKVLDENLSSPYSSQTMFKTHSTDWAVSTASDEFSPLNSGSNHQLPMSRSISDINHHFSFSQSSVVSPVLVAPSPFTTRSPSKIPDAVSSTLNVRRDIDSSSSQSLFAVTPSSLHITSRSTIPHRTSTIRTGSYHEPLPSATTIGYQIRFSSSQSSAVSSEILATSSSPMTSRLQVSHDKNSAVTTSYHKPLISASKIRHQIHLSSPRSAPLFTELVESTSSRQRPSQVPQEKSPFAKESYYQTVISTSDGRHQIPFTASYSSVVTTDYVAPTSSPVISGSEILYHRNSLTSHLRSRSPITHGAISSVTSSHQKCPTSSVTGHQIQFSSRKPAMSTTASSSFLKSPSQIAHKARSVSIYGNSTSDLQSRLLSQSVVMSTEVLQPLSQPTSHFQTPLTTTHVTTSIFPKLRPSFSEIGNQARFSSQSSVGSKELVSPSSRHTKSHFQTPHSTAFVSSSTFQEHLPSTSKIGHHVYFSSAQKSVASTELIAPSLRHTKSYFQTPHSTASVTRSTFQEHLPSTSENGHHVHFSSAPLTSTELVAPSSHPRISSHVAEKRSSAGSKRQTSSSSSRSTAPTSFNKGKLKASSLAVSASQSGKEFTSKIKVSTYDVFNPLNPNIKIQIILLVPYTFLIEVVRRSLIVKDQEAGIILAM